MHSPDATTYWAAIRPASAASHHYADAPREKSTPAPLSPTDAIPNSEPSSNYTSVIEEGFPTLLVNVKLTCVAPTAVTSTASWLCLVAQLVALLPVMHPKPRVTACAGPPSASPAARYFVPLQAFAAGLEKTNARIHSCNLLVDWMGRPLYFGVRSYTPVFHFASLHLQRGRSPPLPNSGVTIALHTHPSTTTLAMEGL